MIKIATICVDASFSAKHKIGSWACYIRTPAHTIKTGSVLKGEIKDSTEAERFGIANALFLINKIVNIEEYKIIIYCDNKTALVKPAIKRTPKSKHHKPSLEKHNWYKDNIESFLIKAIDFETRHVKGHLPKSQWDKNSKKNYMNDWCDKEAKRLLRNEKMKIKRLENKTK